MDKTKRQLLKDLAGAYFSARKNFKNNFKGNDNIVAIIGEEIAVQFLEDMGRTEVLRTASKRNSAVDIISKYNEVEVKTSVKVITSENRVHRTSKIVAGWDELLVVVLNNDYKIENIYVILSGALKSAIDLGIVPSDSYLTVSMLEKLAIASEKYACSTRIDYL